MSFAEGVRDHLPEGMHLPDAFAVTFDWLEAQGWGGVFRQADPGAFSSRYLSIYPPEQMDQPGGSYVLFSFEAGPPLHAPPPEAMARISMIAQIAGDGGTLSLWLDDTGKQWFVVFNHGTPHVLTDDPLKVLQFLAMGYPEPGALFDARATPQEEAGGDTLTLPTAFREFLEGQFSVHIPARASDLGIVVPPDEVEDPIRHWLDQVMPEPEIGAIPGMTAENPYIITSELREVLEDEGIAAIREAYEFVIEEE
ncbi:hypothetical protein V8J82_09250 [Gymnodinialimonas sp. 2305UL16-5]|uniref:hypothetical protein n=1 Tax=Gymnodinialimonas mytili TaxID=3126503 RepID=UPI0030A02F28